MATHDNFIVAVELGSSKVSAVAGEKHPDGAVHILAAEQAPSEAFIRKGRIYNIDKFALCIDQLKKKLENAVGMSVAKAYVGIGGMGMYSVLNSITKHFPEKVKVTEEMIDMIQDENNASQSDDRDIIGVVPQEYKLGMQKTADPVGILTQSITAGCLNIVAPAQTKDQIRDHFAHSRIEVVDLPITFLAVADNMVSDRDRQSGCVFVDMGAQTTNVAVYKSGLLRHLAVIPLGGANITTDIATAYQLDEAEAEEIKLKYDFAIEEIEDDNKEVFTTSDGRVFLLNDLKKLVSARLEEIIANVKHQIDRSQFTGNQLVGGVLLTGGVAQTRNIERAFEIITGITKVKLVRSLNLQYRTNKQDFNNDGSYNGVISLVEKGDENCCGGAIGQPTIFEPAVEQPKTVQTPTLSDVAQPEMSNDGRINGGSIEPETDTDWPNEIEEPETPQEPSVVKKKVSGLGKKMKNFLNKLLSEDE